MAEVGVAEVSEGAARHGGAVPARAVQDDRGVLVGELLVDLQLEEAPRDVDRAGEMAGSPLVAFPHVDQGQGLVAPDHVAHLLELERLDL